MSRRRLAAAALLLSIVAVLFATRWPDSRSPEAFTAAATEPPDAALIARGEYLTQAGSCLSCHTRRGGAPYAGGRSVPTPFGLVFSSNLTPDPETGLGRWSREDFWQALHEGKGRDGRWLYPAFPYPNYTQVTRADADAIFAYLQTLQPVTQRNRAHELRFPFNQQFSLLAWRLLYFRAGEFVADTNQSAQWNRGAYLTQGLGHCNACHSPRNALGATSSATDLSGGLIPVLNWYAPALTGDGDIHGWEQQHLISFLKTGVSARRSVAGPMSEVIANSLQHLNDEDLRAIAGYLQSLPAEPGSSSKPQQDSERRRERVIVAGEKIYEQHCVDCHQADGRGQPPHYPPLAGNGALMARSVVNPLRMILHGGFAPSTAGNPRPYGMPPFSHELDDEQVAAVLSYVRNAWGNQAPLVTAGDVARYRGAPLWIDPPLPFTPPASPDR